MVKRTDDQASREVDLTTRGPIRSSRAAAWRRSRGDRVSRQWHAGRATWRPPMLAQPLRGPEDLRVVEPRAGSTSASWTGCGAWPCATATRSSCGLGTTCRSRIASRPSPPRLAALPADNFTIDGELVAFDGAATSFARLQQPQSPARPELHVFDLLHLLGQGHDRPAALRPPAPAGPSCWRASLTKCAW